ncbi:FAD-binding oxidoreductase [Magnetospira thiophila]
MSSEPFFKDVRKFMAAEDVISDADGIASYTQNTSGLVRSVPGIVKPKSTEQVQQVVQAANSHKMPLYSFSRGRNWGMGSKLPVKDGCVLVDLSGMDKIHEVNDTFGYAVIEPGVTQRQLSEHLKAMKSRFFLDVTGSGAETSILGNMMERGVAYNTLRIELLQQMQVVLGTGEVLETGFGHYAGNKVQNICKFGIGPGLESLFVQSNFGIVTRISFKLVPIPDFQATFVVSLKRKEDLGDLADAMRELTQQGLMESVVHVGNARRSQVTVTPIIYNYMKQQGMNPTREDAEKVVNSQLSGDWSALGCVMGTRGHVFHCVRKIRSKLKRFGKFQVMTPGIREFAKAALNFVPLKNPRIFLNAMDPLLKLPHGEPSNAALHSTYWTTADSSPDPTDPDKGPGGIMFCCPIVPMERDMVNLAMQKTEQIGKELGFDIAVTLNNMHGMTMEGVVSIDYDKRDPEQAKRAVACMRALNQAYMDMGATPYRMDIENMDLILDPEDSFWKTARALKSVLDPNGILSPGRFSLD